MNPLHSSIYKTYINHTDAGGIVYHGNYLTFYENCRRDWFTLLGFDGYFLASDTVDGHNVVYHPVVTDARVRYFQPILLDMEILVTIDEVKIKPASLIFTQSIYASNDISNDTSSAMSNPPQQKLSTSTMTIACVSHSSEPETAEDKSKENDKMSQIQQQTEQSGSKQKLKVARLPVELVTAIENWKNN